METPQGHLSEGALDRILIGREDSLEPVVQVLGTKMMPNNRIRAVITDGLTMCQHCILMYDGCEADFEQGRLNKFTVVRLDAYTINSLPKKNDMPVILVNALSVLKNGDELDRKLGPGDRYMVTESQLMDSNDSGLIPKSVPIAHRAAPPPTARPVAAGASGPSQLSLDKVCPINVLTPFFNAWVIRVRVTNKTAIKTWTNARGEGKLFSFDCCDDSGEIRVTAFNAECDRFFNMIEKNNLYLISRGSIKAANKKFSSLNNDYEMSLNSQSVIEPVLEADGAPLPQIRYKFLPLSELQTYAVQATVDVICVIRSIGVPEQLVSRKTSRELTKREIALVDKSLSEVRLTLWNEQADQFDGKVGQVVAIKGAQVGEFRGKILSTGQSSLIAIEPDVPEATLLRQWYQSTGATEQYQQLSKPMDASAVSQDVRFVGQITPKWVASVSGGGTTAYHNYTAYINATNRPANQLYKACGFNNCMKKVTDYNDGLYHCTKCDRSSPTFEWRMMISLLINDATGSAWVSVFQEQAEKLIGKSTKELAELYEMDQNEYTKVINSIRFQLFNFRVGSRMDEFNNEQRIRNTVFSAVLVKPVERARKLMTMIDAISAQIYG